MSVTPVLKKYKLSARMVEALVSGERGEAVNGKSGTLVALIDRELITPEIRETNHRHLLTDRGREVLAELRAAAQPGEKTAEGSAVAAEGIQLTDYVRITDRGAPEPITRREALAEGSAAMTDRVTVRAHVRTVTRENTPEGTRYEITYKDDRHVILAPAGPKDAGTPTHIRTENGAPALITTRAALDEINAGMMGPTKKLVRQMSAKGSSANLEYFDGRRVDIRPATPEEIAAAQPVEEAPSASYTVVYTGGGEPIVHRTGCAHNVRDSGHGAHRTQVIAGSIDDVCRAVFSDFLGEDDDPGDCYGDLNVKPCAR